MDYKIEINGKYGDQPEDIRFINLKANDKVIPGTTDHEIEAVYITYNDGAVEKFDRGDIEPAIFNDAANVIVIVLPFKSNVPANV